VFGSGVLLGENAEESEEIRGTQSEGCEKSSFKPESLLSTMIGLCVPLIASASFAFVFREARSKNKNPRSVSRTRAWIAERYVEL